MSDLPSPVFVVDDDPAVLKGICRLLRSAGLNPVPFSSPEAFLQTVEPDAPGCLVLDLAMPGLTGLQIQGALAGRHDPRPIIFLTGRADVPSTIQALKGGAVDFLTKPVQDADLLEAVQAALARDGDERRHRAEREEIQRRLGTLTPREREVLDHVVAGHLNKQTAALLGTVEKTIKVHRARVMEKMRVTSVAELVRIMERVPATRPARSAGQPADR